MLFVVASPSQTGFDSPFQKFFAKIIAIVTFISAQALWPSDSPPNGYLINRLKSEFLVVMIGAATSNGQGIALAVDHDIAF